MIRLDKFLSEASPYSRRDVRGLVKRGAVAVNGVPAKTPDMKVNELQDVICVNGEHIIYRKYIYLMMNKPQGYLSATEDDRDPVVVDLLPEEYRHFSPFPVGRLDKDTEGLTFYDLRGVMKPATRYRLTFYIKTQDVVSLFTWGGGVYFSLDCGMKPRKTIGFPVNNGKFLGTMPWTRQSFEFTTPEGFGKDGRPYLSFCRHNRYNDPKGIAWIDQVEIFELPAKK